MKKLLIFAFTAALLGLCACGAVSPEQVQSPEPVQSPEASDTPAETAAPEATEAPCVEPLKSWIDLSSLGDCTLSVSLGEGAVREEGGAPVLEMTVYDYECFDMVDVSTLEAGHVIVVHGEELTVVSVERTDSGAVIINGGYEDGGLDLVSDGDGVYYAVGADDAKDWYEVGKITLPVSGDFVFTDNSELASPGRTMTLGELAAADIVQLHLVPGNTSATLSGGEVAELDKEYMP